MPKLNRPEPSLVGQFILAGLMGSVLVGLVVLAAKHPWLVLASIAALAFWTAYDSRVRSRRLLAMAQERAGRGICEFAKEFDLREVDAWVVRAVYEQLQGYLADIHPKFPINADDVIVNNLVSDPDDLDMSLVYEISERTCRSLESAHANQHGKGLRTVRDLVMFFNAQQPSV